MLLTLVYLVAGHCVALDYLNMYSVTDSLLWSRKLNIVKIQRSSCLMPVPQTEYSTSHTVLNMH